MIHESLCGGCDKSSNYLLDWLAHIIQSPEERTATVPVLISEQGTGKGILMDSVMSSILGKYFVAVGTSAELTAKFNAHLTRKFLTFIDEATWRGNKTEDGILKRLIGSPTMSVEEKFGARYQLENYSRYFIASNNKEAVALERGNRRYCVIESDNRLANNLGYFNKVLRAIEKNQEIEKFTGFLLERDLISYSPYSIIENNTSGKMSKIATEGPVAMFWADLFFEEPYALFEDRGLDCRLAYHRFNEYCKKINTYQRSITAQAFWAKTMEIMPIIPDRKRVRSEGARVYFRDIKPDIMVKSLCETLILEKPTEFFPEDYYNDMNGDF
jgi:hypothetical protein